MCFIEKMNCIRIRKREDCVSGLVRTPGRVGSGIGVRALHRVCGNHLGNRTLAHKAHTQGYYWPTMKVDAASYVKKCDHCQR